MEDFKCIAKMKTFKTGGKVTPYVSRKEFKAYEAEDKKEDQAMINKAIVKEEKGEKTELKLKKGGRAKKEVGTVNKYKAGGEVENVYEAKKSSGDKDNIEKTKAIKPGKADAPSKGAEKQKGGLSFFGGK
jgi:hypothetical protein